MNNKVIFSFLKDIRSLTIGYFTSNILIIVFYYLSIRKDIEIIYPCIIILFIYLIIIGIEFYKHYGFGIAVINCVNNKEYDLKAITQEQKLIQQMNNSLHEIYNTQLNAQKSENEKRQYMLTQWIHNIKTPISVIDLILQMALRKNYFDNNILSDIKAENDKSIEQLERLLTILRLEDFPRDFMLEPVDLITQIYKLINQRRNQFIYNNVFPKFLTDRKECMILTDSKWNEILLEQMISNAIKYSDSVSQSKYVYFNIVQEEKRTKLIIRDEGIGISEYDQKRIFEPFVTGENGRLLHNSTGIGLYICKIIAEQLGIDIRVASEKNKGSSFTLSYLSKL